MSLELLADYITNKVRRVNLNNPKANTGAKLIKLHGGTDMIYDFTKFAVENMQGFFQFDNQRTSTPGECGLTMASMSIGEAVLKGLDYKGTGKAAKMDQVRTGDLFIEALVVHGFVYLQRPVTRDAMYTIHASEDWPLVGEKLDYLVKELRGTKHEPYTDGCRIKEELSKRDQKTVWCTSAKKLMGVPWRINKPVYEALRANQDMFTSTVPLEDEKMEQKRRSKLVEMKFILSKAELLQDEVFYQEIEADYRGRLYYVEPFLNFQGNDLSRGIMMFDEAKPMTPEGQWWLAVHTASSYNQSYDIDDIPAWCEADYYSYLKSEGLDSISVDKFTLEDRVRWTNENMEVIIDAGRERVFADAEKPISFLACCIEWGDIEQAQGQGRVHMSRLPVPIDGSNNGWQHLGAMSRDRQTGELVGLIPSEIQSDFYVQTAKELLKIDDPKLNAMPMKHIRKGISKRGSMTRAYSAGAGKIGENMWFDCRSEDYHVKYDIEEKDCKRWANELIKAINKVCPGPLSTMKYLQQVAEFEIGTYNKYRDGEYAGPEYYKLRQEISTLWSEEEKDTDRIDELLKESKEYYSVLTRGNGQKKIKWKTPSGFPVVYESYRQETFKCRGTIAGKQIKHTIKYNTEAPDIKGFMSGISPNFVHSMDASHMALVIDQFDGAFGAVHDSFSTHACDVDELLDLTKRTFVEMYDVDNFYDYIEQTILSDKEGFDVEQPELGSLEILGVYTSDYFFA